MMHDKAHRIVDMLQQYADDRQMGADDDETQPLYDLLDDMRAILAEADPPDPRDLGGMREIVAMLADECSVGTIIAELLTAKASEILARRAAGAPRGVWVELTDDVRAAIAENATGSVYDCWAPEIADAFLAAYHAQYPQTGEVGT